MGKGPLTLRLLYLTVGLIQGVPSGQTCFTYNCNFERPCQLETGYTGHQDVQWRVHNGGTPSSGTGPTFGYGGFGNYTYMEASDPAEQGDTTWLTLPVPGYSGAVCVEFAYHMQGQHIGRLDLYTTSGSNGRSPNLWSIEGEQGPDWIRQNVTVILGTTNTQISFLGTKGSEYQGDIGLDSINVTCGRCGEVRAQTTARSRTTSDQPIPTTTPFSSSTARTTIGASTCTDYSCDFESTCANRSRYTGLNADILWRRNSGRTPSSGTGPTAGYGGNGSYMYMETSGQNVSGSTWLSIPASGYSGQVCVQFAYHMYGEHMGSLRLLVEDPSLGSRTVILNMSGNKENRWWTTRLTAMMPTSRAQLTWQGIRGPGFKSDIALDEIRVDCGPCYGTCMSYYCDFENTCVYSAGHNGTNSAVRWRRQRGGTPSNDTGPSSGFGGFGYYIYMETSGRNVPGSTWLSIPASGYIGPICVGFAYHMYGNQTGSLHLLVSDPVIGSGPVLWSRTGSQGNAWIIARETVLMPTDQSQITWIGIKGSGFRSDIAIDEISVQCGACNTDATVRLVGGATAYEGRLEVRYNGTWGTVCDDAFSAIDASVFCRMLNFSEDGELLSRNEYSPGSGRIWLDQVGCRSYDRHINQCAHNPWGNHDCSHSEDVGIRCMQTIVRLVGGLNIYEGRLEVRYNGIWGTVCDDFFTAIDAAVFCRMLNYSETGSVLPRSEYPVGNGVIWLDDVRCSSAHRHINQCGPNSWGQHNCDHTEDVGIRCANTVVCRNSQFSCDNRRQCYDLSDKCDGFPDCDDGSDEAYCPCPENDGAAMFRCSNGRCVSWEVVCDGADDCRDNSDENNNCSSCSLGYFRCDNRCLPIFRRCNGIIDCSDTSDEIACECPSGEFRCSGYCYTPRVICQYNMECLGDLSLDCAALAAGPPPCGIPAVTPRQYHPFIINGREAIPNSWPWQVSIVQYNTVLGDWRHNCGGSLITPCWVLTAAHCVDSNIGSMRVRAGIHDRTSTVPFEETVGFRRAVVHPGYVRFRNDIALIQLNRCLPLSDKIGTVCLPALDAADGMTCTVTGWGRTEGTGDRRVLQELDVTVLNNIFCERTYIYPSHICATARRPRGICRGDSGGPLSCMRNGVYEVHGIASFGNIVPSCIARTRPDVYTRVTSYISFIRSVVPTNASCTIAATNTLAECDFEGGFCNLFNDRLATGTWRRRSGSTPTSNTGPTSGYNNSRYYAYHESSSATLSRLVTPTLCTVSGDSICLSVCYHMFGSAVGKLSVTVDGKPVMTIRGNQGNRWKCRNTFVRSVSRHSWVTFIALSGGSTGDIAIDNIVIRRGNCA